MLNKCRSNKHIQIKKNLLFFDNSAICFQERRKNQVSLATIERATENAPR